MKYAHNRCGDEKNSQQMALQIGVRMIIIHLRFTGGSTGEGHDIAHIASSIFSARLVRVFFRLLLFSHLNIVFFQHRAELMIGYAKQLRGALLVKARLLQTGGNQRLLLLMLPPAQIQRQLG